MSENHNSLQDHKYCSSQCNGDSPVPTDTNSNDDGRISNGAENDSTLVFYNSALNKVNNVEAQRERRNMTAKERRANMSDEQKAIANAKRAEYQRKRRAEVKASEPGKHETTLMKQREYHHNTIEVRHEKQREYRENTIEVRHHNEKLFRRDNSDKIAENRRNKLQEMKASDPEKYENHLARRREYQNKRYAQMKDAELKLQNMAEVEDDDINIRHLQNLAVKRRKLIDAAIENRRNNKRTKWVQILQVWDEDHPCQ